MLHDIHDHVEWHPRYYTNLRTYYRTGLYNRFWHYYLILEVFIESCNGYGLPTDDACTPLDTWSCPISDLHLFQCWDHSFLNLSCLRTFWFSNIPRYFYFDLQWYYISFIEPSDYFRFNSWLTNHKEVHQLAKSHAQWFTSNKFKRVRQ